MSFPLKLIKAVWGARITFFWPIWITITFLAAICVARVIDRAAVRNTQETASKVRTPRYVSRSIVAVLMLLVVFLVSYIVLILTWEDFAWSDNSMFTLSTLRGYDLSPPIWRGMGRFFPLGHQEFNLIHRFTGTVVGYHFLPIIQLLTLCGILLVLDDELSITARAGLTAFALVIPGIVISFGGLIYPERNLVLWLVCLALCIKCFERTRATAWAVSAVVCAQIMIYYKETGFLLLWGFALGRLVLRCKKADQAGLDHERLRDKESRLDLCLASLGVLFLLYYVAVMLPHPNMEYADERHLRTGEALFAYLKLDLLAWLLAAVVLWRVHGILRQEVVPSPFWDGLAFGGLTYFTAFLCLRMYSAYYLAPVDLIAVLYLGRFAILSWGRRHLRSKVAGLVLLFVVLLQDISLSAFRLFERKNVIHGKVEIARVIKAQYRSGAGNVLRVFFPFTSPYRVMEFAAYLNYRGVPVEGAAIESARLNRFVLFCRAVAKDGPCVGYESLVCHAGSSPDPGDLVIVLPDDDASLAEISRYRDRGELLLSYEPYPRLPQWLNPFVSRLHVASYAFAQKKLPDRWLQASVTVWK